MSNKSVKKAKNAAAEAGGNEMSERIWSVVSFERVEASKLTYDEAVLKLGECEVAGKSGLCIVTDTAAARMTR